jgi:hypothetical protein
MRFNLGGFCFSPKGTSFLLLDFNQDTYSFKKGVKPLCSGAKPLSKGSFAEEELLKMER